MSEETARKVIARIEKMKETHEELEDETLQDFALTIQYLLSQRSRREEVLALASSLSALDEYRTSLKKRIEYAKIGGLKEREATLLEMLDQFDKELEMAVSMKVHQHSHQEDMASDIQQAILKHLEPTLGRGKWHAREEAAILKIISKVMEGYLVVKLGS
jgi:superfamily II DNA helicase RecQ